MFTPARCANLGLLAAGAVFVVCMLILGTRASDRQLDAARRAPAFELTDTEGHAVSLASLRGKITVLAFGSLQCPGTSAYCDRLVRLARHYQDSGQVSLFMVNVGEGSDPSTLNQIRLHSRFIGQSFPTLLDADWRVARKFGVDRTPSVVVIDQRGMVRYRGPFDDNRDERQVKRVYCAEVIRSLLGETQDAMALTQAFGPVYWPK